VFSNAQNRFGAPCPEDQQKGGAMSLISDKCEECGKVVTYEKDEDGLGVIKKGFGEIVNACSDCIEEHRRQMKPPNDEAQE
jgi:hypothetical protein